MKNIKFITSLNDQLWQIIFPALQISGLDPQSNMAYIGERLTKAQYDFVQGFLEWLQAENLTIGHGNYQDRFIQYAEAMELRA